jgi:hypothetical protein
MNKQRRKNINDVIKRLTAVQSEFDKSELSDIKSDIEGIRDEEQDYFDNMPESLQGGEKGDAAQEAVNAMEDAIGYLEEVENDEIVEEQDVADKIQEAIDRLSDIA